MTRTAREPKHYLQRLGQPYLTKEEQWALADRAAAGDKAARDELVTANYRLVLKAAHRFRCVGLDFEDLVGAGLIGLTKAADRYRSEHRKCFSTYAMFWICKAIRCAVHDNATLVRIPRHVYRKIHAIRKVRPDIRMPFTAADAIDALSCTPRQAAAIARASVAIAPREAQEFAWEDFAAPQSEVSTEIAWPAALTDADRQILTWAYGLDGGPTLPIDDLAKKLRCRRKQAAAALHAARTRLRLLLAKQEEKPQREGSTRLREIRKFPRKTS